MHRPRSSSGREALDDAARDVNPQAKKTMRLLARSVMPIAVVGLLAVLSGCSEADTLEAPAPSGTIAQSSGPVQGGDHRAARAAAIEVVTTTMPCPNAPVALEGEVIRIEGDCDVVDIEVRGGVVILDDVDALTVSGSAVLVYADAVDELVVSGADNVVVWRGPPPHIDDTGMRNAFPHE